MKTGYSYNLTLLKQHNLSYVINMT